jgi:cellobiose phosphorylase
VDELHFDPCLPAGWAGFKIHYRFRETVYHIAIVQASGPAAMTIDGEAHAPGAIPLVDDGREHTVELRLGGG